MKSVSQIYEQMREAWVRETGTPLEETGELSLRLYTLATELYGLYVQNHWTLLQCFPQTATGDYLDKHGALRSITRNEAEKAGGTIRFYAQEARQTNLEIPKGTLCMTAAQVAFETTQAGVLLAGTTYVDIPAQAVEAGASGNVPPQSIWAMSVAPVGVSRCLNLQAFVGGADREEDASLRERVLDSFRRMPNGANAAYYEREALSFAPVAAANVLARNRGPGTVDVAIAQRAGTPSAELIQAVEAHLQKLREIAVNVKVIGPVQQVVPVSMRLTVSLGRNAQEVKEEATQALLDYFDGRRLGKAFLRAQLGQLVFSIDGVENYSITAPATDLPAVPGRLYLLGSLSIEVTT